MNYGLIGAVLLSAALSVLLFASRAQTMTERAGRAADRAAWTQQVAEAESAARKREGALQALVDQAKGELDVQNAAITEQAARIAGLTVDARGLRGQLAAARADRGVTESIAACASYVAELETAVTGGGELLVEGQVLVRQFAEAHDRRAAEVAALLQAWPK